MTPANGLTLLRLALAPVAAYAIVTGQDLWVLALLAVAGLTDVTDGWLARATRGVSRLGTILDPVADKVFASVMLVAGAVAHKLPGWLALAYAGKELLQMAVGAVFLARLKGAPIGANRYGKAATVLTFTGFFLLWLGAEMGWWPILAGLGVGLYAAWTYLRAALSRQTAEGA